MPKSRRTAKSPAKASRRPSRTENRKENTKKVASRARPKPQPHVNVRKAATTAAAPEAAPPSAPSPSHPARKPGFYEAVAIYERGVQALQRHDFQGAAGFFRTVLERYPDERELLERARLYLRVCERETEQIGRAHV